MQILSPMRLIAAALFALSALLGAPSVSDAPLAIGVPAAAAAQEGQTAPRYWQMYYNFAPPTDEFIAELAAAQGVPYTPGRTGEARFYADDGRPIYPSNDGAVGVIVTVTLPAGDVLTVRRRDATSPPTARRSSSGRCRARRARGTFTSTASSVPSSMSKRGRSPRGSDARAAASSTSSPTAL